MSGEPCAACGSRVPARRWSWKNPLTDELLVRRLCPSCRHGSDVFEGWELHD